jgi:serine/threonine-protein kinase
VPAGLSDITMRAIAHDPAQRYRSARQMSQALKQWLDAEADIGSDDNAPARRGRRRLIAATLVVGAAIGAVLGWQLLGTEAEPARTAEVSAPAAAAAAPAPPVLASGVLAAATISAPGTVHDDAATSLSSSQVEAPAASAPAAAPPAPRPHAVERPAVRESRPARETNARSAAAAATGVVQLAVTPWGQIEVDGKGAGVTPPLSQLTLSVGEHVITVRNADFAPHSVTVRVLADQPVVVRHRFGS